MAWTSGIFRQFTADALAPTASFAPNLSTGGTWTVPLYPTGVSPDNTVTAANSAYGAGVWTGEITDTNWPAKGRALAWGTATRWTSTSTYVMFDSDDTTGAGNVTLAGVFGDLVFDDGKTTPVADQGLCFHSFGGTQGVTAGTFCADDETEILTRRGWLRYGQVRAGEECLTLNTGTGAEEWQPIGAVHVFTDGPYPVIRLEGPGHSSVTTPDHRWPAETPGAGISWHTTRTLPPDAQLLIGGTERTGKVKDLARAEETAALVWCVETPNRTWYARRNGTMYHTGNTVVWHANGVARWTHTAA